MANSVKEQIEELVASLLELIDGNSKSTLMLSENLTNVTKIVNVFTEELMRFRAWEALLYLFFARYYMEKADPIGAATFDRDFLADQHRKFAQDEAGAQDIIKLYDAIFAYIKAGQEAKHLRAEGEKEDTVM